MKMETKKRLRHFLIVLGCAVILRIIVAFTIPIETQRYFSLGIMIAAIISFFAWESIEEQKKKHD